MKQNKAYKFRIYPNEEQKIIFAKTFGCTRFIYNKMLSDKIDYYQQTKQKLNNTPAQYKTEFEWLKEVDSLALANAQMNLQKAFTNFFNNPKSGFPKFKSKHKNRKSYTTNNQRNTITLKNGYLKLPKLVDLVRVKQHRQIPKDHKIKSVTISQTTSGKYYASILCEYESQIQTVEPKTFLGLDFSMKELYVASDNTSAEYPRYFRKSQEKLAREQRKLSKCVTGSQKRNKQRLKVAKLHEKVANQRKDFLHKLSRQIANAYDCVCIEDLDMKAMSQALNFGKSVADNSWGVFTTFLKYKLEDLGKQLIKIDKWFPSSKTCSNCGNVKENLSLSDRAYHCSNCGITLNRDYNASVNIKNQGMKLVIS
ncbi:MAG TPA: transposase [Ruminococcus sp.]|nr:transposase [Ruminococcus sp.]